MKTFRVQSGIYSAVIVICSLFIFSVAAGNAAETETAGKTGNDEPVRYLRQLPARTLNSVKSLAKVIDPNIITLPAKLPYTTLAENLKKLPSQGLEDARKAYFNTDNILLLLMAAGGSIALHDRTDDAVADNFANHRVLNRDVDKMTDYLGNPGTHFAATGLWYLLAAHDKNELSKQRSWAMMKALSITGATTVILKGINNNRTPNGKRFAWPSGHTASSFCVASVLDEFYGHKIGYPAYLTAGYIGFRMMDSGDHWASDVLFGAVLGYIVGHSVASEHKQIEIAGFGIVPLSPIDSYSSVAGIALAKDF